MNVTGSWMNNPKRYAVLAFVALVVVIFLLAIRNDIYFNVKRDLDSRKGGKKTLLLASVLIALYYL